jgi:hypothetical protein
MRTVGPILCLTLAGWLGDVSAAPAKEPASHLVLTKGIVGGFVPPHISEQVVITGADGGADIHVMRQPQRNAPTTFLRGRLTAEQYQALFDQTQKLGLWGLPREVPAGSEDIYQMDTSINARLGEKTWYNGGPAGCVHGESKVKANAEERAKFQKMAAALREAAIAHAKTPSDEGTFQKALRSVQAQTPGPKGQVPAPVNDR